MLVQAIGAAGAGRLGPAALANKDAGKMPALPKS